MNKGRLIIMLMGVLIVMWGIYFMLSLTPIELDTTDMECVETWDGDRLVEKVCRRANTALDYWIPADSAGDIEGTGSMLPLLDIEDKMYYRTVGENEMLWKGRIYTYRINETDLIIHRLISNYIGEDGEEYLIFKGDNNIRADEPVLRGQVEQELIGVCFNDYC